MPITEGSLVDLKRQPHQRFSLLDPIALLGAEQPSCSSEAPPSDGRLPRAASAISSARRISGSASSSRTGVAAAVVARLLKQEPPPLGSCLSKAASAISQCPPHQRFGFLGSAGFVQQSRQIVQAKSSHRRVVACRGPPRRSQAPAASVARPLRVGWCAAAVAPESFDASATRFGFVSAAHLGKRLALLLLGLLPPRKVHQHTPQFSSAGRSAPRNCPRFPAYLAER